jgi:hypothetical protein
MIWLGQPMFDPVLTTYAFERRPRNLAVGRDRFFGKSANWTPLSVSTISTL